MPVIDRPLSNIARNAVLRNSKIRKDQVPPIPNNPYTPGTVAWLDLFQPQYKAKFDVVSAALHTQTSLTAQVTHAKKLAVFYEEDFVLALQRAIRRELFPKTDRSYYGIPVDSRETLKVSTETQIIDANEVLTTGETNRTTAGGTPISFPSIGDVNNMVNNFISLNNSQAPAKLNFDDKQGELSALNPEADRLILKLWNETETAFDTGDKADMRRRAREWGVVYKPKKGEALSPDDFSIAGMITETGTGIKLGDVEVKVIQTGYVYVSKSNGDYLVPK